MKPAERVAIAFGFAVLCLFGFSSLALWSRKAETEKASEGVTVTSLPPRASAPEQEPTKPEAKPPELKQHIEELLAENAENGERADPGAVFLTSRIREAVREGNPAFAKELLRQMKEEFPDSILVYEAEEIVKLSR